MKLADEVAADKRAPAEDEIKALPRHTVSMDCALFGPKGSFEIAARMHIAACTVEVHRCNIMRKLGLHSVAELTKYTIREG